MQLVGSGAYAAQTGWAGADLLTAAGLLCHFSRRAAAAQSFCASSQPAHPGHPLPPPLPAPLTVQVPLHNVANLELRGNAAAVAKLEEHLEQGEEGREGEQGASRAAGWGARRHATPAARRGRQAKAGKLRCPGPHLVSRREQDEVGARPLRCACTSGRAAEQSSAP